MYNSITGTITHRDAGGVYLLCNGIEWDIKMPEMSVRALPLSDSETTVYTYLHHREDVMKLYGFSSSDERSVFLDLLKVSGIGPSQALKILSGIGIQRFVDALDANDIPVLTAIPGLGQKTAQKIVLALRGKLTIGTEKEDPAGDEIVDSLVNMGFDKKLAQSAVSQVVTDMGISTEERAAHENEIFRKAIVQLSSQGV